MVDKINNNNINNIRIVVPTTPRKKYKQKPKPTSSTAQKNLSILQNRATSSGPQPNISIGGPNIMFPPNQQPPPNLPVAPAPAPVIPVTDRTFKTPKKIPMGGDEPVGGGTQAPLYDSKTADKKTTSTGNYGEPVVKKEKDRSLHPEDTEDPTGPRSRSAVSRRSPTTATRITSTAYENQPSVRAQPRTRNSNAMLELTDDERRNFVLHRGTGPLTEVLNLTGPPARNVRVDSQGNIVSAMNPLPPVRTSPRPLSPSVRQRLTDTRLSTPTGSVRNTLRGGELR
jgi:hypothetical protein